MTKAADTPIDKYLTPIAVLLGAIIIALAFAFNTGERPEQDAGGSVDIKNVKTEGSPYVGSASAPVTMAVWYDFQCRYCKQFEATTLSEVTRDYVESGKVRIVYKDFQFLGPESIDTAVYSRAVWEVAPNAWGEWFVKVMAGEGETTLTTAGLDAISTSLGIDTARVAKLVSEKRSEYEAAITADRTEGQTFGITGTPGSIIGTTMIGGAQSYLPTGRSGEKPVKPLIDAELAK